MRKGAEGIADWHAGSASRQGGFDGHCRKNEAVRVCQNLAQRGETVFTHAGLGRHGRVM